MNVLGVIVCEVLELEFAHLLRADPEIARISVVDEAVSARLIDALESGPSSRLRRIAHLGEVEDEPVPGLEVVVRVLELALHQRRKTLQGGLLEAARELAPHVDALLLGYGLCGNALEDPEGLLAEAGVPVFIPMDGDHPVDDCVGLVIGGRDEYYGEQCRVAGTFFMTPGWTFHWKRIFDRDFGNISVDLAKRLFANYERSLLISTPLMSEAEMRRNAAEFNELFDCRAESQEGTLGILHDAWEQAKGSVSETR